MTARFKTTSSWVGLESSKNIFETFFQKYPRLTQTTLFTQETPNDLFVELKSEVNPKTLKPLLEAVAKDANLEFLAVGWGWIISDDIQGVSSRENSLGVNFEAKRYTVTSITVVYSVSIWILIIFLAAVTFVNIIANPMIITYWIGFALVIVLAFARLFQVREIICNDEGVKVKHLFPSEKFIPWHEIVGLKVRLLRGFVCTIETRKGFGVHFLVGKYFGMENAETLVKTIAKKSKLYIVDGTEWDNSRYIQYEG